MSTGSPASSPTPGHDILARYLHAYANARQMSDIERPWGLGDDTLDAMWMRLTEALAGDPRRLDRMVAEELTESDRKRIAATLSPLIFALPLRAYPSELRAVRSGPRLVLSLCHSLAPESREPKEKPGLALVLASKNSCPEGGKRGKPPGDEAIGFLPAALTPSFCAYLRKTLKFARGKARREVTVSSGGRRRRVRVTLLPQARGLVIRFLERMPSPVEESR